MLRSLPAALLSRTLVTDMLSVKQHAKDVMLDCVPADSDVLCMHPMFGPDSGRNSWRNLPCVYEQVCPPPVTACPHLATPLVVTGYHHLRVAAGARLRLPPRRAVPIALRGRRL